MATPVNTIEEKLFQTAYEIYKSKKIAASLEIPDDKQLRNGEFSPEKFKEDIISDEAKILDLSLIKEDVLSGYKKKKVSSASGDVNQLVAQIHGVRGFNQDQQQKLYAAIKLLLFIINGDTFAKQFLDIKNLTECEPALNAGHPCIGMFTKQTINHGDIKEKQNLLAYIRSGRDAFDKQNSIPDGDIDIDISLFHHWNPKSSVIGYTLPDTQRTWVRDRFFKNSKLADLAGHIMHEYCHKLGFNHFGVWETSIPYTVGDLVCAIAKQCTSEADIEKQLIVDPEDKPINSGNDFAKSDLIITTADVKKCSIQ